MNTSASPTPTAGGGASPSSKKPASPWTWRRVLCVLLVLITATLTGLYGLRQYRINRHLQQILDRLDRDDPGWRLSEIEEARVQIPEEENSARLIPHVFQKLPQGWPSPEFDKLFEDLAPEEQLTDEAFETLQEELKAQCPAVILARRLADLQRGRHHIEYQVDPMATLLTDQKNTRVVAHLMRYEAIYQAQQGDAKAALVAARATLNAGRSLGDEPFGLSQLVRTALVTIGVHSVERVLAQGEPPRADLKSLQELLANERAFPGARIALRGDRAVLHQFLTAVAEKRLPAASLIHNGSDNRSAGSPGWLLLDQAHAQHPVVLELLTEYLQLADLPVTEQVAMATVLLNRIWSLTDRGSTTRNLLVFAHEVHETFHRKDALLASVVVGVAAERYRQERGDWPASLEALTPDYLPTLPGDPFTGQPLRYRRLDDGVLIYSVGPDFKDDGGNMDRSNGLRPDTDLGIRLWDVSQRRQPPRPPAPADPGK